MAVDFDRLVNRPAVRHFGRPATYLPGGDNPGAAGGSFEISVIPQLDDVEAGGDGAVPQFDSEAIVDIRRADLRAGIEITLDDDEYRDGDRLVLEGRTWRVVSCQDYLEGIARLYLRESD